MDNKEYGSRFYTEQARNSPGGVYFMGYHLNTEEDELKRIELAARTCYKSEDKITDESAKKMFAMLVNRGHFAMTRFGERTVTLIPRIWSCMKTILTENNLLQYWRWIEIKDDNGSPKNVVTSNLNSWINLVLIMGCIANKGKLRENHTYRTIPEIAITIKEIFKDWPTVSEIIVPILDNIVQQGKMVGITPMCIYTDTGWLTLWKEVYSEDLEKLEYKPLRRYCFRVVTDRGITHEIVRHTTLSYAQESTRYVRYNSNEPLALKNLMFIPDHLKDHPAFNPITPNSFYTTMGIGIEAYEYWLRHEDEQMKMAPGDARNMLPHCLKTEICISGYIDESPYGREFNQGFSHFVDMRFDIHAHKGIQPIAREIMKHIDYHLDIPTCG